MPGALAVATLATCALFATATGIVGAVVTLMGLLALPQMLKAGYDSRLASGVICAGGCLGILIPPSIMLIVYGAMAGAVGGQALRRGHDARLPAGRHVHRLRGRRCAILKPERWRRRCPRKRATCRSAKSLVMLFKSFFPLALLILSVLGAIMFGLATPTEAAAVGALRRRGCSRSAYRAFTWQAAARSRCS